jgi:hypothetical protein
VALEPATPFQITGAFDSRESLAQARQRFVNGHGSYQVAESITGCRCRRRAAEPWLPTGSIGFPKTTPKQRRHEGPGVLF